MIEKLIAKIEYAEAHDDYDEADKLRERIETVKSQAVEKKLKKANKVLEGGKTSKDGVRVVHHGGNKQKRTAKITPELSA